MTQFFSILLNSSLVVADQVLGPQAGGGYRDQASYAANHDRQRGADQRSNGSRLHLSELRPAMKKIMFTDVIRPRR